MPPPLPSSTSFFDVIRHRPSVRSGRQRASIERDARRPIAEIVVSGTRAISVRRGERRRGKVRKPRRRWYRKARALVVTDFKRASSSHVFTYPVHARVSILSASIHVLVAETRTSGARTSERSRPTQRTDRRPTLNFIHTHAHTCAVRSRRDAYAEYETTFPWIDSAGPTASFDPTEMKRWRVGFIGHRIEP